jgi:hypothetical protein
MLHFATKSDIENLMVTNKDELISALKAIYDTPDDTCYRVASTAVTNRGLLAHYTSVSEL